MQKCIGCNKRKQLNKHNRCSKCQAMADQARGRRAAEIAAAAAAPADDGTGRGHGGSKPPHINRQGQRRGPPR